VVRRGLARSRHRAKQLIVGGHIRVQGAVVTKAATPVSEQQALEVDAQALPYVSRAGNKLDFALSTWDLPVQGATCLDVGASTGGFTDVLLRRGAARVYAVDVGHGQLDPALRADARVVNLEGMDVRSMVLPPGPRPTLAVVDVSFISVLKVLHVVAAALAPGGTIVAVVKPQFERSPSPAVQGAVGAALSDEALLEELRSRLEAAGLHPQSVVASPLKGMGGTQEFLLRAVVSAQHAAAGATKTP